MESWLFIVQPYAHFCKLGGRGFHGPIRALQKDAELSYYTYERFFDAGRRLEQNAYVCARSLRAIILPNIAGNLPETYRISPETAEYQPEINRILPYITGNLRKLPNI